MSLVVVSLEGIFEVVLGVGSHELNVLRTVTVHADDGFVEGDDRRRLWQFACGEFHAYQFAAGRIVGTAAFVCRVGVETVFNLIGCVALQSLQQVNGRAAESPGAIFLQAGISLLPVVLGTTLILWENGIVHEQLGYVSCHRGVETEDLQLGYTCLVHQFATLVGQVGPAAVVIDTIGDGYSCDGWVVGNDTATASTTVIDGAVEINGIGTVMSILILEPCLGNTLIGGVDGQAAGFFVIHSIVSNGEVAFHLALHRPDAVAINTTSGETTCGNGIVSLGGDIYLLQGIAVARKLVGLQGYIGDVDFLDVPAGLHGLACKLLGVLTEQRLPVVLVGSDIGRKSSW